MEKQRTEILQQVSAMFCKYGIKSVSMDDVARELGISKKTLYQLFRDKEELVERSIGFVQETHHARFEEFGLLPLNAIERVLAVNEHLREMFNERNPALEFDLRKYYPKLFHKIHHQGDSRQVALMVRNIFQGREEGLYRSDFDAELISQLHYRKVLDLATNYELPETISRPEAMFQIMSYHLRGICTPKGLAFLEEKTQQKHAE